MGTPAAGRAARRRPAARPGQGLSVVYHIASRADWDAATARGAYRTASLDTEGFIHCSTAEQVAGVASAFYRGRRDLVLLRIDTARLRCPVRFEPPVDPATGAADPSSGERFPHVYGELPLAAVDAAVDLPPGSDGTFTLPAALR